MLELDENGKLIDILEERNKDIKKRLEDVLDSFKNEMAASKRKSMRVGYRFAKQLQAQLITYGQMDLDVAAKMNYETLNRYWIKYNELIAYYNRWFELVDNKQLFMLFCGINDDIYRQWEQSLDEKLVNLMKTINTIYVGSGFIASESGNASPTAIKTRLSAKNVGHNVISASEELVAQAVQARTPYEIEREVRAALGMKKSKQE